jgi:Gram-negative bacterial TonB protein C-terminal
MKNSILNRFRFVKIVVIMICCFTTILNSQNSVSKIQDSTIQKQDDIISFCGNAIVPEFIGGQKAMFQFLSDNIEMPKFDSVKTKDLIKRNHTVYIGFTVSKNGEIKNVMTKKGIKGFPEFEEEAMRVVKLMDGKWTAGKQNGEFVDVNYTLPLKFKIE